MKLFRKDLSITGIIIVGIVWMFALGVSPVNAQTVRPWFQVWGGDVHTNGNLRSRPFRSGGGNCGTGSCAADQASKPNRRKFSLNDLDNTGVSGFVAPIVGDSGIVSYESHTSGGSDCFCTGSLSESDQTWFIDKFPGDLYTSGSDYNYAFFKSLVGGWTNYGQPTIHPSIHLPSDGGIPELYYEVNSDFTIDNNITAASAQKYVFLISGNLIINRRIKITNGTNSFIAFIVNGQILVDPSLAGDLNNPDIEGVFIAQQQIRTGTKCTTPPTCLPPDSFDDPLYAAGIFVAQGGFNLQRRLGDNLPGSRDGLEPAEVFIFRPDFFYSAPSRIKQKMFSWQEVNP